MEIDKRTRWWWPEDDEKATSGIPDCPRVLPIGRGFCCRRLMPGDLASARGKTIASTSTVDTSLQRERCSLLVGVSIRIFQLLVGVSILIIRIFQLSE